MFHLDFQLLIWVFGNTLLISKSLLSSQVCVRPSNGTDVLPLEVLACYLFKVCCCCDFAFWYGYFLKRPVLRSGVCVGPSNGTDVLPLKAGFQHIWDLSLIGQHAPLSRDAEVNDLLEHNIWIVSVGSETSNFQYNSADYVSLCGPYRILPSIWRLTNLKTVAVSAAPFLREESIIVGSSSDPWVITCDPGDPRAAQKLIITFSHLFFSHPSSPLLLLAFFCARPPLWRAHREEVRVGLAALSTHPSARLFLQRALS